MLRGERELCGAEESVCVWNSSVVPKRSPIPGESRLCPKSLPCSLMLGFSLRLQRDPRGYLNSVVGYILWRCYQ